MSEKGRRTRTRAGSSIIAGTVLFLCTVARAQYLTVIGSPLYTYAGGGYAFPNGPFGPSGPTPVVNDSGAVATTLIKYDPFAFSGVARPLAWTPATSPYELGILGTINGGISNNGVNGINQAGTIVGYVDQYSPSEDLGSNAVRWEPGSTVPVVLGNLGTDSAGRPDSTAYAINASGTVAGMSIKYDASHNDLGHRAVRWDASETAAMELPLPGPNLHDTDATTINDAGTIIGTGGQYDAVGNYYGQQAIRWDASGQSATFLGSLGRSTFGDFGSTPKAINAGGLIVGASSKYDANGNLVGPRAVRWDPSGTAATELAVLSTDANGVGSAGAFAVNDAGIAVGYSWMYTGGNFSGQVAVRWDSTGTGVTELGTLGAPSSGAIYTFARAINDDGIAVGYANKYDATGTNLGQHAVFWTPSGEAVDLNDLIDPASGWLLYDATAISDSGWITGLARF